MAKFRNDETGEIFEVDLAEGQDLAVDALESARPAPTLNPSQQAFAEAHPELAEINAAITSLGNAELMQSAKRGLGLGARIIPTVKN